MRFMNRTNLRVLTVATLLLLCVVDSQAQKSKLHEAQALRLAEQFIAQNGYTDLPPDKSRLAYETIEWKSNIDEMLSARHDMLQRNACGIVRGRKGGSSGWTVVFRYKNSPPGHPYGRAVTMRSNGSQIRIEHVDFILRFVAKKL
jgi:hypothetical protein